MFGNLRCLRARDRRPANGAERFQPEIEGLESRCLPSTFTVTNLGDSNVLGSGSLRDAINQANSAGGANTIVFSGVGASGTIQIGSELPAIGGQLTIQGPGASALSVQRLSTSPQFRIVTNNGTATIISGLTLTGGNPGTASPGGAILNFGTLTLQACVLTGNTAGSGGAICSYAGGVLDIVQTTFSNNTANGPSNNPYSGSGGAIRTSGTTTVTGSSFQSNSATHDGGAIRANNASVLIQNTFFQQNSSSSQGGAVAGFYSGLLTVQSCVFQQNTSSYDGGGIADVYMPLTLQNSTLSGNTTGGAGGAILIGAGASISYCAITGNTAGGSSYGFGGGVAIENSAPTTITDSTIANNAVNTSSSNGCGGGLYIWNAGATLINCTVSGNSENGGRGGGGIYINNGSVYLTNTIVAKNTSTASFNGPDIHGTVATANNDLIGINTSLTITTGNSNLIGTASTPLDPKLGNLANNGGPTQTMALLSGSPAIDAGTNSVLSAPTNLTLEQRGYNRLYGSAVDIGAYEFGYQTPALTSATSTTFTTGTSGSFNVTATGFPAPTFTETGTLPSGVTLSSAGLLSGTPAAGTVGTYTFTITASNGVAPNATQSFTLTVDQAPVITSATSTTFTTGTSGSFNVTATGFPAPTFTETGTLPGGVTLSSAGLLNGTPAAGTGGTFNITITASNGVQPDATQSFTLIVDQPPVITSKNTAKFTVGSAGSFAAVATGFPSPTFSESGTLPSGVTLSSAGVLSGTPAPGTGGVYHFTITASNGVGTDAKQSFTLIVTPHYVAVGAGPGGGPVVKVYDASTGTLVTTLIAFSPAFAGGVRVAVADVNGDGIPDIICGAGPGAGPEVAVFDGTTFQRIMDFMALPATFTGGIFVAAGDLNHTGYADIVTAADAGGGPEVTIWDGKSGANLAGFYATAAIFTGGIRVACADLDGNGFDVVIAAAGPGGGPQVTIFSGQTMSLVTAFYALPSTFTGGMYVAAGDVNGTGYIIVGAEKGGGPEVNIFNGVTQQSLNAFYALPAVFTGGVRVALSSDYKGHPAILSVAGPGGGPQLSIFDALSQTQLDSFYAFPSNFGGGVYVGDN
jgi:predicted outer membrane repeat protein